MATILVCDDAADLRLLMRLTLERAGHEVVEADGGRMALVLLDSLDAVDLVLLDVQMPVQDGWSVLSAIRAHPTCRDVPIVMCTVKFSHADLIRAWTLGCDDYVNKPFDLDLLVATVESLLDSTTEDRLLRRQTELTALTESTLA